MLQHRPQAVRERDQPRAERDGLPRETRRIAAAVEALVVVQDDLPHLDRRVQGFERLQAGLHVLLDALALGRRQRASLPNRCGGTQPRPAS